MRLRHGHGHAARMAGFCPQVVGHADRLAIRIPVRRRRSNWTEPGSPAAEPPEPQFLPTLLTFLIRIREVLVAKLRSTTWADVVVLRGGLHLIESTNRAEIAPPLLPSARFVDSIR